ncbi:desmocollin-2-like [Chanos chanos]|uniref:Desmocollin-2-like n=1 Tax=Chanos chanos TaxID=29144 RepID=A0A6J2VEV0_CHACN|nr:desmocollin-2-like [Chanos chanos]
MPKVHKSGILKRIKRRWRPLPFNIIENDTPPFPKDVEIVASDSSAQHSVYYTISGPGVTEEPIGLFSLDKFSGLLKVHRAVDREVYPQIKFQARVFDIRTNVETDLPLPIIVNVKDVNDNKPTFVGGLRYSVPEQCKAETVVGTVNATDRDDPETDHTKIRYSLLSGQQYFSIHAQTGVLSTRAVCLDREVKSTYFAVVEIRDMNGAHNGLSNTGTATVVLADINDHPPTFTETSYTVKVSENQGGTLLLRIPVEDKDVKNTPNWNAVYIINKGNEDGYFRTETDPKTNDCLLYLVKPLDYEKIKDLKLEIQARNEAELKGTSASWVSVPITVEVTDVDEGPEFNPEILYLSVMENTPNGTIIGKYTALDPETKTSNGIKYYEVKDPGSWVSIDENTGEIRVTNTIDRESPLLVDGLYNVTVKAVDASSKSSTGTIVIRVDDENDNSPVISSKELIVCEGNNEPGSALIIATDKDRMPFSAPFSFTLHEPNDGKWTLSKLNDTAATLNPNEAVPYGLYKVTVLVRDLQGHGDTQTLSVQVSKCRNGERVPQDTSIELGVWGILALLFGLALLLREFLLAALVCKTKQDKLQLEDSGESGGMLLKSNTEGPGEGVNLKSPSFVIDHDSLKGSIASVGKTAAMDQKMVSGAWYGAQQPFVEHTKNVLMTEMKDMQPAGTISMDNYNRTALTNHTWRTNGLFLDQKLGYMNLEEDGRFADDIIHSYGYEGRGSPTGSVGCCSDMDQPDNTEFLNGLGTKFRPLADISIKK